MITVKGSAKAILCSTAYREETHFSGNHSDHLCLILSENYEAKYWLYKIQMHQNICFCHLKTKNDLDRYLHRFFDLILDTVTIFLIKLGIKLRSHLLEIGIFSLNDVIARRNQL